MQFAEYALGILPTSDESRVIFMKSWALLAKLAVVIRILRLLLVVVLINQKPLPVGAA